MRVHYLDNGGGARVLTAKCYGSRLVSDGVVSGDGSTAAPGLEAKPETSLYIIHIEVHIIYNISVYYIYMYIVRNESHATKRPYIILKPCQMHAYIKIHIIHYNVLYVFLYIKIIHRVIF